MSAGARVCARLLGSEELHKIVVDQLQIFFTLPCIHTLCNMTSRLFSLNSRVCVSIPCIWVGLVPCFGWYSAYFHVLSQTSANMKCARLGYSTRGWKINGENQVPNQYQKHSHQLNITEGASRDQNNWAAKPSLNYRLLESYIK